MKWCEIFKTGKHTDSAGVEKEWTLEDLNTIVSNFQTVNPDVPICCGHVKSNSPAYGWVDNLRIEGDKLYASFKDVQNEFKEAVNKGLFRTRSISLSPELILRHVAFLGAMPPAIKGMEQFCFNESDENDFNIEFSIYGGENMTDNQEPEITQPGVSDSVSDFNEQMKEKEEVIQKLKKELDENRLKSLKHEYEDFCDKAISEGNITPAQKGAVLDILFANTDTSINFEDGSTKTSNEVFKDFIKSLHQIEFSDIAGDDKVSEEDKDKDFSSPEVIRDEIFTVQEKYAAMGIELNAAQAYEKIKK